MTAVGASSPSAQLFASLQTALGAYCSMMGKFANVAMVTSPCCCWYFKYRSGCFRVLGVWALQSRVADRRVVTVTSGKRA